MFNPTTNTTPATRMTWILKSFTGSKRPETDAAALLDVFGSIETVIEAHPEALAKVVSIGTAEKLASILPLIRLYHAEKAGEKTIISNRKSLESFCKSILAGEKYEKFVVVCVNAQCRVLGYKVISNGTLSEVSAYPRLVAENALNYNAHSVFFAHNHPGGTCHPSPEDIASTIQLQRLLKGMDILTLDHMILAGNNCYSMAQHGDVTFGR